jgi:hypothetical protein
MRDPSPLAGKFSEVRGWCGKIVFTAAFTVREFKNSAVIFYINAVAFVKCPVHGEFQK